MAKKLKIKKSSPTSPWQDNKTILGGMLIVVILLALLYVTIAPIGKFMLSGQTQYSSTAQKIFYSPIDADTDANACNAAASCKGNCFGIPFPESQKTSSYSPMCCGDDSGEYYKFIETASGIIGACCNSPSDILKRDKDVISCADPTVKEEKVTKEYTTKVFADRQGNMFSVANSEDANQLYELASMKNGEKKTTILDSNGNILSGETDFKSMDYDGYIY